MERITSRKNRIITHLRALGADRGYRRETGLFVCDGEKFLREAAAFGAEIDCVLWCEAPLFELDVAAVQICAPREIVEYASALKNTAGPVFSVKVKDLRGAAGARLNSAIVLEGVQDPGNVGTVLRTADAFGIGAVVLVGACADVYNPKTVRSTMGAIFRQTVFEADFDGLRELLAENDLPLYGAALSDGARDIRELDLSRAAVAIGSEGAGLSDRLLGMCAGQVVIPMSGECESLNAAVAGAVAMWEIARGR